MAQIAVTGAAGFIGSHITRFLLEAGHEVIGLVRDEKEVSAEGLAKRQLARLGVSDSLVANFSVIPTDIADFDSLALVSRLGAVEAVWHCAALVSLNDAREKESIRSNVIGTKKIIKLAEALGADLHYISTAYVAGSHKDILRENDLDIGQNFRNPYERTKFEAETLVRSAFSEDRVQGNIYRLGIVIGDSKTGATTSLLGYYQCLALMAHFAQKGLKPIRIPGNGEANLSLVPLDYVINLLKDLSGTVHNKAFHLTPPQPQTVGWWLRESLRVLGINDIEIYQPGSLEIENELETMLVDKLKPFLPYMSGEPTFDTANVAGALSKQPELDLDVTYVQRVVQFAVKENFGQPTTVGTRT